jgi:hypothetical protein
VVHATISITVVVLKQEITIAFSLNIAAWVVAIITCIATQIAKSGRKIDALVLVVVLLLDIATIVTTTITSAIAAVAITTRDIVTIVASNILGLPPITAATTTMPIV